MGLHSGTMVHTLIVVVIVAVLAVKVKSVDYRCRYMETKVDNCTRTVYYPCPEDAEGTAEPSDEDDEAPTIVEEYIAGILRRWYGGATANWCERQETYTCVMYRCYIGCCPGWRWDEETRTCSIREDPKPTIECLNGGKAVEGPYGPRCECPAMYTGSRCEEVMCELNCLNNGMCDLVDGQPQCICTDDFNGTQCQHPNCHGGCGMYGICMADNGEAKCKCQPGYMGRNCEIQVEEKEGDCPPISSSNYGTCAVSCQSDNNCPGKKKCCHNGCGQMCMHPASYVCRYNGTNYNIGQVFQPDPCHVCTCLNPNPRKRFGGAQCRSPTCPSIQEGCQRVEKAKDTCCEYCADAEPPPGYKKPKFVNCPTTFITVDIAHDRNEGRLPFTLEARDHRNNKLAVTVSRTLFTAGVGDENFDTVIATTSPDSMGNYAYCAFHVRIRDIHAPNFTYCPTDVDLTEEGKAHWQLPDAVDNVGLARPPTSRDKPGQTLFHKGKHAVVYTTEDWEGNIARCHFFVRVAERRPYGGVGLTEQNRHLIFIGSGIAAFLLIIVIIIVAILCRRRRRGRAEEATPPPPAYTNGIYSVGPIKPPPYKEKPPVFANEADPVPEKKMDDVEVDKAPLDTGDIDVKLGVDNPTYRL